MAHESVRLRKRLIVKPLSWAGTPSETIMPVRYMRIEFKHLQWSENRGFMAAIEPSQQGFHTLLGVKAGRFILLMDYLILIHATDF
jgi:hypothetical protein